MRGFKNHQAASRFCREHHPRRRHNQIVSASLRRSRLAKATRVALDFMAAA